MRSEQRARGSEKRAKSSRNVKENKELEECEKRAKGSRNVEASKELEGVRSSKELEECDKRAKRSRNVRNEQRVWCLCTKYNVEMTDESERGGEI